MTKLYKYLSLLLLVGMLVLIRVFEEQLFYDPYLAFFKNDYLYIDSPRQEVFKLTLYTSLRYILNTIISLGTLYVLFRDIGVLKFATLIYVIAYIILISLFLYFVINPRKEDYYLFFNTRRFLIQPLILLMLIPAFYYDRQRS